MLKTVQCGAKLVGRSTSKRRAFGNFLLLPYLFHLNFLSSRRGYYDNNCNYLHSYKYLYCIAILYSPCVVWGGFKPLNLTGPIKIYSISIAFGIEMMAGEGWDGIGIG